MTTAARVVCVALKTYGVILADVGRSWFLTGQASNSWSEVIPDVQAFWNEMDRMKGSDMEVIKAPFPGQLLAHAGLHFCSFHADKCVFLLAA
jgi:hypothetical protein